MYCKIMVLVATCFAANIMCFTQVTVEEGKPVTLKCTDSVSKTSYTLFEWYLGGVQNSLGDFANRATIDGTTGALNILSTKVSDEHIYSCWFQFTATGDIKNETQLTITVTPAQQDLMITTRPTGPVEEGETVTFKCSASRVKPPPRQMYWQFTDDASQHNGTYRNERNADNLTSSVSVEYTMVVNRKDNGRKLICHFVTETKKDIKSEEATVKVLYKPSGKPKIILRDRKVKVDSAVSLTCDIEQVDGEITWFKWQFVNGTELVKTTEMTWTYRTRGNAETLQFVCIAENAVGRSSSSAPIEVKIQRFVSGQPVNSRSVIVVFGTLLALSVAVNLVVAACCCLRRNSTDGRDLVQDNNVPLQKDSNRCVTKDQGLAMVDDAAYEEVDNVTGIKGLDLNLKQNFKGPTRDHVVLQNVNIDDVVQYEDMDAVNAGRSIRNHNQFYENRQVDMVPSDYEEPRGDAPTYLELH